VEPFEKLLESAGESPAPPKPARSQVGQVIRLPGLSEERRQLLGLRLRRRAPAAAWFPGAAAAQGTRLFCFPYAGGGTGTFAGWRRLRGVCPVLLPGRESRSAEAPFDRMAALVEALAGAIGQYLDRPFAFFGHSMGAAVAFELARELRRRGLPQPSLLIASAARAPQFRRGYTPPPAPSDEQFLAELRRLDGFPADALDDSALLAAILPALKADAALYRNYVYTEDAPLDCPIRAYGGLADPNVVPAHLKAWAGETSATFAMRLFPGAHFFPHAEKEAVLDALAEDVEKAC
jgi:surfactin synthase thioesterase subunit